MRRSLSSDLMWSASAALVGAIALVFGLWKAVVYLHPGWMAKYDLSGSSRHVVDGLRFDADDRPTAVHLPSNMQRVVDALPVDVFYQLLDEHNRVVLSSNGMSESLVPDRNALTPAPRRFEAALGGLPLHALVIAVQRPHRTTYVLVARSVRFDEGLLEELASTARMSAVIATAMALSIFGAVVFITVNRMLKRLRSISNAAAQIEPTSFAARLATDGVPAEIAPLIVSFNAALARLEHGYRVQQEFLATAAHELKTPLALMRGQIEVEGAADTDALLKDLDHMSRQVNQLLHLAEVSEAANFDWTELDATAIVGDAIGFLGHLTQSRRVDVRLQRPPTPVMLRADSGALFVLVRNLIENAVHHSPAHGTIVVAIDWNGLVVRDQGAGIDDADLPMIFKRFWRGALRRDDGAGLGLSICEEIVKMHGWTITAANASPGARFQVDFGVMEAGHGDGAPLVTASEPPLATA